MDIHGRREGVWEFKGLGHQNRRGTGQAGNAYLNGGGHGEYVDIKWNGHSKIQSIYIKHSGTCIHILQKEKMNPFHGLMLLPKPYGKERKVLVFAKVGPLFLCFSHLLLCYSVCGRRGDLVVSVLDSGSSGPGSSTVQAGR